MIHPIQSNTIDGVTGDVNARHVRTHHCNFHCFLTGDVLAHHISLFRACAFETPATFHI